MHVKTTLSHLIKSSLRKTRFLMIWRSDNSTKIHWLKSLPIYIHFGCWLRIGIIFNFQNYWHIWALKGNSAWVPGRNVRKAYSWTNEKVVRRLTDDVSETAALLQKERRISIRALSLVSVLQFFRRTMCSHNNHPSPSFPLVHKH